MSQRNQYIIQVIEKIGAPLLSAVSARSGVQSGEDAAKTDAHRIAELLARAVQISIDMGRMIDIEKVDADTAESLRVALAALAGPVIADHYKTSGRVPAEADIKRIMTALEAVMTFSDNFTPSTENIARLSLMEAQGAPADAHQINVQYIQAFVPAVDAIAAFSFGQPEKKLVLDMCDRVVRKAESICAVSFGAGLDDASGKRIRLALVRALADIYAQSHRARVADLSKLKEPDMSAQTDAMRGIWDDFEKRSAMMEALAQHIIPGGSSAAAQDGQAGQGPAPVQSETSFVAPQQPVPPVVQSPPEAPSAPLPVEQPVQQSPLSPASAPVAPPPPVNPLSMFAPKKPEEDAGQAAPPVPPLPPQTPPQAPVPPPIFQRPQPAEQQPVPPAPPTGEEQKDGSQSGAQGGGPMSFFKKPAD